MSEPAPCDHGVTFDPLVASLILGKWTPRNPAEFILGNRSSAEIRKRFPRGWFTAESPCPGCGYVGIAYASYEHYIAGDW